MMEDERIMYREIQEGECWLAGFATPSPSPESVARVKQELRAELARRAGTPIRSWAVWHGVLAAAAALAFAVTIGWHSSRHSASVSVALADAETESSWWTETHREAVVLTDLEEDLAELEAWSTEESWNVSGAALYETIHNALEDAAGSNNAGDKGASAAPAPISEKREEV
jgi:hypothetical protein